MTHRIADAVIVKPLHDKQSLPRLTSVSMRRCDAAPSEQGTHGVLVPALHQPRAAAFQDANEVD